MARRIAIIDGHPDPDPDRFCHALAKAYAAGARDAGHEIRTVMLPSLDFPFLRGADDWEHQAAPLAVREVQEAIGWADHLVFVYPLWLGTMPARFKALMEQVLRPGFALAQDRMSLNAGLLKGRSARIVVTMGMPALVYRWYFFAHSLRSFERNILRFCGIGPIRETLIGGVAGLDAKKFGIWRDRLEALGREGR